MKVTKFVLLGVIFQILLVGQDFGEKVDKIFSRIEDSNGKNLWADITELEELGRGATDDVRKGLRRSNSYITIAAAKFLYTNDYKEEAIEAFLKVLSTSQDKNACKISARLISNLVPNDNDIAESKMDEINGKISKLIESCDEDTVKIALLSATYSLGPTITPKRILKEIFNNADAKEVKDEAALALAQMDAFSHVKDHLKKLAKEPGDNGRLAKVHLKVYELTEQINRSIKTALTKELSEQYKMLEEIIQLLKDNYHDPTKLDMLKIIEHAARGMCSSLDLHTMYLDQKMLEEQKSELEQEYGGIGARVSMRKDQRSGISWLTIEEPIFTGPAYKLGLRSLDRIVEVEGEPTANREIQELIQKLRGKPGTKVKIKVMRYGWTKPQDFEISREEIKIDNVTYGVLPGEIGYIKLANFGENDDILMRNAIKDLESKSVNSVILDLRGDTGGYLQTAIKIADLFLETGKTIVKIEAKNEKVDPKEYETQDEQMFTLPMVILIDGGSASASEILAGALRDHNIAKLVGEKTFGKGSVQKLFYLKSTDGKTAIKITIARWFLPSSESVEKDDIKESGIKPDIEAQLPERDLWKDREFSRIESEDAIHKYLNDTYQKNKKLFSTLAEADGGDHSKYPDFDSLYDSLGTRATKEEIRELLRRFIRKQIQDERGKEFTFDYQEDVQLQAAIIEIAKLAQLDIQKIDQYKLFAHKAK